MENNQNNAGNNGAHGSKGQRTRNQRQQEQDEEFTDCLREYMVLGEAFHVAMSFKDFCTIKHPEWYEPQVSVDKKVKVPRKKVLVSEDFDASKNEENVDSSYVSSPANEHMDAHEALEPETTKEIWAESQMDLHASSHVEDVCNEDDDTITSSTPLALSYEAHNTSAHDGQVDGAYGEMSQSTNVEDSTSYLSSDAYDDEGVLAPKYDEDSMPYPIYDIYDDACMIVPEYDKGWVLKKLPWDIDLSSQEPCVEDDKEGVDLVDENKSEILYEDDSPHESHHCMVSSSELVGVDGDNILSDESKSENPLCDNPHHVDEIEQRPLALHDLEDRLLVTEEKIVQVLTREDGAHKFIEDLIWKNLDGGETKRSCRWSH
jgi:hypothetical protein